MGWLRFGSALLVILMLAACGSTSAETASPEADAPDPAATASTAAAASEALEASPEDSPEVSPETAAVDRPEWFGMEMTDVQTGESFTIDDYAGKVVLLETMAVWCPTCRKQGDEVKRLHELLDHPEDLISISLDVDMGEDEAMLKNYTEKLDYDWNFAVAPLLVARALGNEYSAQYLNPPVSPMLIVDRDGSVLGLPFGGVKSAESLQGVLEPLLEG